MRRLYSTFAGGWPGIGLLVMRLVVGSVLLVRAGPMLWSAPPLHLTLTSASRRYRAFFSPRAYGRLWLEQSLP